MNLSCANQHIDELDALESRKAGLGFALEKPGREGAAVLDGALATTLYRDKEESCRRIVEAANGGIWNLDESGRTVLVNQKMAEMMGYTVDEMMDKPYHLFVDEEWRKIIEEKLARRRRGFKGQNEYKLRRKDGSDLWAIVNGAPIFGEDGGYAGVIGMFTDITDRKRAEEELNRYRELLEKVVEDWTAKLNRTKLRLRQEIEERRRLEETRDQLVSILESTPDFVATASPDRRLQYLNGAAREMLGIGEQEETSNLQISDVYPERVYQGAIEEAIQTAVRDGAWMGETVFLARTGREIPVSEVIIAHKHPDGAVSYLSTIARDITKEEEIRRERQYLQEQKARMQRLTSLSALSAGIVHEIGQPLNTIKLLADTMLFLCNRGDSISVEDYAKNLRQISEQAGQINLLIIQMRSFAKSWSDNNGVPCSLNAAVKGIMNILGRQLSTHGITVRTELEEKLPSILGTANGFEEAALNLLANAMHALDSAGKQEKEIIIKTYRADSQAVLEVGDNATGISKEIEERIFEPLFSTKGPGEGMGLGLSIVQAIIERFNGVIEVQNNARGGATFRMKFPVCGAPAGRLMA